MADIESYMRQQHKTTVAIEDKQLDQLSNTVGLIKAGVQNTGTQLDQHNKMLTKINKKAD
jgi:hypothetical protein